MNVDLRTYSLSRAMKTVEEIGQQPPAEEVRLILDDQVIKLNLLRVINQLDIKHRIKTEHHKIFIDLSLKTKKEPEEAQESSLAKGKWLVLDSDHVGQKDYGHGRTLLEDMFLHSPPHGMSGTFLVHRAVMLVDQRESLAAIQKSLSHWAGNLYACEESIAFYGVEPVPKIKRISWKSFTAQIPISDWIRF